MSGKPGPWLVRVAAIALLICCASAMAELTRSNALLFIDFSNPDANLKFVQSPAVIQSRAGPVLEFTTPLQFVEKDFSRALNGVEAVSIGGWFFPRRTGEQYFLFRGIPRTAAQGERMFPPEPDWVNFVLGTDQHGFLLGAINGNGSMPFPRVTLSEVQFDAWNQLVIVKHRNGRQAFYHNGLLVHTDANATTGGVAREFRDTAEGQPLRLAMAMGGMIGEAWIFPRELSAREIADDFAAKKSRYNPAIPVQAPALREMDSHPGAGLWKQTLTATNWPMERERIAAAALQVLGPFPKTKVPLNPMNLGETDCGDYVRRKISIQVQPGDGMPAYLLVPKSLKGRVPAIICFYGTSAGAGKDTTVGLSGLAPGSPPKRNYAFAVDMVEAGFVALAPDYLRDGERVKPGRRPYDTTDFYQQFPDWSVHGKDVWDTSRAIDYLETLDFVDTNRVGMTGHSYGGHSTIFAAAMEPRIKVAVANGPVSDFIHHGLHWGVPKGAANSQSLPNMRPYVLDHTIRAPLTFYEFTALTAPRPLLVGHAVGERRPMEEENYAAVKEVYTALSVPERVRYHWYAGDHDYPPEARAAAVAWFKHWFAQPD